MNISQENRYCVIGETSGSNTGSGRQRNWFKTQQEAIEHGKSIYIKRHRGEVVRMYVVKCVAIIGDAFESVPVTVLDGE